MATRIETLGGERRAPKAAWIVLLAIVLVAAALTVGALVGSGDSIKAPAGSAGERVATAVEPAFEVPALVHGGLQPRPFTKMPTSDEASVPDGFVRMPHGQEFRPKFGS